MKCIFLLLHFTNIYNILCTDFVIKFIAILYKVSGHFVQRPFCTFSSFLDENFD